MELFEVIAQLGDEEKVEKMVADIYCHYYSFVNFTNLGETIFIVNGEPGVIVRYMGDGSFFISRGLKMTKLMRDILYVPKRLLNQG